MAGQGSPGLAWPGLASLRLAWRGIYSEVTLTAYLPAALRLALVTRFFTFAPGIPVYPRSAFYRDSQNDGEFTAPPALPHPRTVLCVIAVTREPTVVKFSQKKKLLHLVCFDSLRE